MYDVLRFWLDRGVDGFRVDVIWLLIKDAALRDNPENPLINRRIRRLIAYCRSTMPTSPKFTR
jgi:glycosidase